MADIEENYRESSEKIIFFSYEEKYALLRMPFYPRMTDILNDTLKIIAESA